MTLAPISDVPALLDHLVLGCNQLNRGIEFLEKHTGVRAAFGGVHPGRGTCNALLSLGERCYLEVMAPDPEQSVLTWFPRLPHLHEPRLVGWMVHPADLSGLAFRMRGSGTAHDGPHPGSRLRPDGRRLSWQKLDLTDDRNGILPSFIAWDDDSPHPAEDAPGGCRLLQLKVQAPDPEELARLYDSLGVEIKIEPASGPRLHACVAGPAGVCELSSC